MKLIGNCLPFLMCLHKLSGTGRDFGREICLPFLRITYKICCRSVIVYFIQVGRFCGEMFEDERT